MTDRIHSLTVVLENDIRIDDAEALINAIRQMRRVIAVEPNVSDVSDMVAISRARNELTGKIWEALNGKRS